MGTGVKDKPGERVGHRVSGRMVYYDEINM